MEGVTVAKSKETKKITPLMKQFNSIKGKHPDALLLFRVGDFYETFGADAIRASEILGIVLTQRNNGGDMTALAGFPHHALNTYLPKLVRAGLRVAICDQLEDPKQTKTIVKRGVTELVTPGVALNEDLLEGKANNFLAALYQGRQQTGLAFLDISTGEFLVAQGSEAYADKLLQHFSPAELLISKGQKQQLHALFDLNAYCFYPEDWVYQEDYARENLKGHFKTNSLKGFGVEPLTDAIIAAGAVLHYLSETQHHQLNHITSLKPVEDDNCLSMDRFTVRNLELIPGYNPESVSLLNAIDHTGTAMGGRLLRRWLVMPSRQLPEIIARHEAVAALVKEENYRADLREFLRNISDLERLVSRVATGKINPRETVALRASLEKSTLVAALLQNSENENLRLFGGKFRDCTAIIARIKQVIAEDAPVQMGKGQVIASGYSEELDQLRILAFSGKEYLDDLVEREAFSTGINSLKIGSNNVFGYYLEVRNTHKDKVPVSWIRKQTLVNAERYITEELKEYEQKILSAEERIEELEAQLFSQLLVWMHEHIPVVQHNAAILAEIDCIAGFAHLAVLNKYSRPTMTEDYTLEICEGRHPVIENQLPPGEEYVPNDLYLDREAQQIIMITGPNMSGKSALLRQTALMVILAQMGSFIPAKSATIGVVDKIFTRVGASDNITRGESTFMVEMNETASILNNLSDRSLVLLDEIGRGTSTYDGISIAWAITEYLHEHPTKPKTLFATHYHELNEMAVTFPRIKNYNVSIRELKDRVIFLRKLEPGGSEHSFGIHVAKLAGMPQHVIRKANKILKKLEASHTSENMTDELRTLESDMQLSFFNLDDPLLEEIKDEILHLDIDTLTPVEALMKLNEIRRLLVKNKKATS